MKNYYITMQKICSITNKSYDYLLTDIIIFSSRKHEENIASVNAEYIVELLYMPQLYIVQYLNIFDSLTKS